MPKIEIILQNVKSGRISPQDAIRQLEYLWVSQSCNSNKHQPMALVKRPLSPEELMIEQENAMERDIFLENFLRSLSERYRAILIMFAVECKTINEISVELGISKQAVSTYLKRIRKRARKLNVQIPYPIDEYINY